MLSGHKIVKIVLEMKFQDKAKSKRCDCLMQKMIVGRHYCYKGKGIYSGTCSMQYGYFPNVKQVKPLSLPDFSCILKKNSELHFVIVALYLLFKYYRKRLSSLMH